MSQISTASVPGSLCLAGESLDWMTGGSSIVAAVPLYTRATAWREQTAEGLFLSSGPQLYASERIEIDRIGNGKIDSPLSHMIAAAYASVPDPQSLRGLCLSVSTESPIGAGLSSSAAVTLASAAAVMALESGVKPEVASIASTAFHAESEILEVGSGWMDFLACAYGGLGKVYASESEPKIDRIALSLGAPIVLIDTKTRRQTVNVLHSKRERFRAKEPDMMTYVSVAESVVSDLDSALRASRPSLEIVGNLINEAQEVLKRCVKCSTPLIDECVDRCLSAGAYGAKLSGSGHGGGLFAIVSPDIVDPVLEVLNELPVYVQVFNDIDTQGVSQ